MVIGCLITVEMPNTSDYAVDEFKKNLAFIQMIEASYVDLVKAARGMFEGVNRSSLNKAVEFFKVMPIFGLLTWFYIPQTAKIMMLISMWLSALACHPLGVQITQTLLLRLNVLTLSQAEPTSMAAKIVNSVTQKVNSMTASPGPSNQLIRDVVLFENQRWWLGVSFVPKFIMDGSLPSYIRGVSLDRLVEQRSATPRHTPAVLRRSLLGLGRRLETRDRRNHRHERLGIRHQFHLQELGWKERNA